MKLDRLKNGRRFAHTKRICGSPGILRSSLAGVAGQLVFLLLLSPEVFAQEWRFYGGDAGGTRFSALQQINRSNVGRLKRAWTYHMGEIDRGGNETDRHHVAPFESTPLMVDGVLYFSTPSNRVIALKAETGKEIWQFDPQAGHSGQRQFFQHRGVSYWQNRNGEDRRILRSEEHTSELQSRGHLVCRLLLEKKKKT